MIEQLLDNNQSTVKVVFKHFPLGMHKQARPAAYASIAAGRQKKFWEYHNELFLNSSRLDKSGTFLEIAKKLNLDIQIFSKDMVDQNAKNKVKEDINDGNKAGVVGVPAIFINGKRLKIHSLIEAQKVINDEIKKVGK